MKNTLSFWGKLLGNTVISAVGYSLVLPTVIIMGFIENLLKKRFESDFVLIARIWGIVFLVLIPTVWYFTKYESLLFISVVAYIMHGVLAAKAVPMAFMTELDGLSKAYRG